MKTDQINIRDPFVLLHEERYYMYGTRSATCWGPAEGFDCYVSEDLNDWEGPIEIFKRPEGFFGDRSYWAPECYYYQNSFYLVTTFGAEDRKKGIYILKSESPKGPFRPYSGCITPREWSCIDGSIYWEGEIPYLIFSHSFEDTPDGDMCLLALKPDLQEAAGEPVTLFSAVEAKWANPVPFAKQEFGMDGDVYFTDGPCVKRLGDSLCMTWSSWGTNGYAVGGAYSESDSVMGPWKQVEEPLFAENGGHGMMFEDKEGNLKYALHFPNDKYKERPLFQDIVVKNNKIELKEKVEK
ncbi:glycoside hydrolase family 43 protein [Konateibacter massiliensis]|uniref:glycoside hydrolase family 43 protein n=1 Tax=Konateibacter massiliensis TaxID=2002841 RepID=UPI000C14E8BD|nr:family 43 glycosylhydrolase [Konateibacter massiliensis]